MKRILLAAAALWGVAPSLEATSVVPPHDLGAMARLSQAVVMAQVLESHSLRGRSGIETRIKCLLEASLGPDAPQRIFYLAIPGGALLEQGLGMAVGGMPSFVPGRSYLLFLRKRDDAVWQLPFASLGVMEEVQPGVLQLVEQVKELAFFGPSAIALQTRYDKNALLRELAAALAGQAYQVERAFAEGVMPSAPSNCVRMVHSGDGLPIRWFGFETGTRIGVWFTTPGQTGLGDGGQEAVINGTAAWRNYSAAVLNLDYNGVKARTLDCAQGNRAGEVWFDDPCNAIPDLTGCSGTLAFGGTYYSLSTQTYDGVVWHPALNQGNYGPFVVVNNGSQCIGNSNFQEMMTHELGHSLGFGHHTDPTAVMYFMCCRGNGAQIYSTDKVCASDQYHTFLDVPYAHWAWSYIEGVEDAGVTSGCGAGNFCPASSLTRAQMAVFLLKAKYGSSYTPPPCAGLFGDVACPGHWAANWVEALMAEGITSGCGGGNFCPDNNVTRAHMAVFLLKAKNGGAYVPPPCSGVFADVPCPTHWAVDWVEDLANSGVTSGCGGGNYCPQQILRRDQMAVFLVKNFSLPHP